MGDSTRTSRIIRILSRLRIYPHRFFLLRIGPQKLLEYDELMALADLRSGDRVLDLGCGAGAQTILLSTRCSHVVGVDISGEALTHARSHAASSRTNDRLDLVRADITRISFTNGSFNKIISFCVLEHVPGWREVLRMSRDWLAPDGFLVISVDSLATIENEDTIAIHRRDHSVQTYFESESLTAALTQAGYTDIEVHPILRSDYAKRLFVSTMLSNKPGRRSMMRALIEYNRLKKADRKAANATKGIFLVARARMKKP